MAKSLCPFLEKTARGAGEILMAHFGKTHRIKEKRGAGIVTEADTRAEKFILKNISRNFPKSSIITEESGKFSGHDDLCWVIDPLDGTTNFAANFPWFCVSSGVYEKGVPRAGVVYQPVTKEMFTAEKGKGATLNGKRIHVSRTRKIRESLLGTGFYYSRGTRLRRELVYFRKLNEVARGVRRPGAAAIDLAFVACGRYDGFWERGLSPWDVAAGMLLVSEAGGKLSDYKGKDATLFGYELVASNGHIHNAMTNRLS